MHKQFVRPLNELAAKHKKAAEATIAASRDEQRRHAIVAAAMAVLMSAGIGLAMVLTTRSVAAALPGTRDRARAIGAGDLAAHEAPPQHGEIGELFVALDEMRGSLARLVAGIRQIADGLRLLSAEVASGTRT